VNFMSGDLQVALAQDRANRFLAEAENHRLAMSARRPGPGPIDRLARSVDRGWSAIRASFEIDGRPRIPAI
jgi:hypothetical protein